jgi:hypothetical protein
MLATGEYPSVGPGFSLFHVGVKVDSTTVLTTMNPAAHVDWWSKWMPQLEVWWWNVNGLMTQNPDGSYTILISHHAAIITNDGKNFLAAQISGTAGTTASYISLTTCTHTPAAGDHNLWNEITDANGLARAGGSYTLTGTGTWTVAHTFTASGAGYTNVQSDALDNAATHTNGTVICEDTFTPISLSGANGDKLTENWSLSGS